MTIFYFNSLGINFYIESDIGWFVNIYYGEISSRILRVMQLKIVRDNEMGKMIKNRIVV